MFAWYHNLFLKLAHKGSKDPVLTINEQMRYWQKASRKMNWHISDAEFERLNATPLPTLTKEDRERGFIGTALFYGFGDDGRGNSHAVLSGKLAWDYVLKQRKTWQCEYVDFNKPQDIRLREGAPARPKGFPKPHEPPGLKPRPD